MKLTESQRTRQTQKDRILGRGRSRANRGAGREEIWHGLWWRNPGKRARGNL